MTIDQDTTVAVLIATRNRPELLRERALASVAAQTLQPCVVVLVNDGVTWTGEELADLHRRLPGCEVQCLPNTRHPGVGGAWNTGVARLLDRGWDGFVALIDDDDLWDADHLEQNQRAALRDSANVVVAGLRIRSSAGVVPRPLITGLRDRDFLVGNPGWQGSNTFVKIDQLAAVGGFLESLRSLHDRDVAVRLLRHSATRSTLVPAWTATWCIDRDGRLSDRRGEAKRDGLRTFWQIYAGEMSPEEQRAFLDRTEQLFGFTAAEIAVLGGGESGSTSTAHGGLHAST